MQDQDGLGRNEASQIDGPKSDLKTCFFGVYQPEQPGKQLNHLCPPSLPLLLPCLRSALIRSSSDLLVPPGTLSVIYLIILVTVKAVHLGFHLDFHWFQASQFYVPGEAFSVAASGTCFYLQHLQEAFIEVT